MSEHDENDLVEQIEAIVDQMERMNATLEAILVMLKRLASGVEVIANQA